MNNTIQFCGCFCLKHFKGEVTSAPLESNLWLLSNRFLDHSTCLSLVGKTKSLAPRLTLLDQRMSGCKRYNVAKASYFSGESTYELFTYSLCILNWNRRKYFNREKSIKPSLISQYRYRNETKQNKYYYNQFYSLELT